MSANPVVQTAVVLEGIDLGSYYSSAERFNWPDERFVNLDGTLTRWVCFGAAHVFVGWLAMVAAGRLLRRRAF